MDDDAALRSQLDFLRVELVHVAQVHGETAIPRDSGGPVLRARRMKVHRRRLRDAPKKDGVRRELLEIDCAGLLDGLAENLGGSEDGVEAHVEVHALRDADIARLAVPGALVEDETALDAQERLSQVRRYAQHAAPGVLRPGPVGGQQPAFHAQHQAQLVVLLQLHPHLRIIGQAVHGAVRVHQVRAGAADLGVQNLPVRAIVAVARHVHPGVFDAGEVFVIDVEVQRAGVHPPGVARVGDPGVGDRVGAHPLDAPGEAADGCGGHLRPVFEREALAALARDVGSEIQPQPADASVGRPAGAHLRAAGDFLAVRSEQPGVVRRIDRSHGKRHAGGHRP